MTESTSMTPLQWIVDAERMADSVAKIAQGVDSLNKIFPMTDDGKQIDLRNLVSLIRKTTAPDMFTDLGNALSQGQITSKKWLINRLSLIDRKFDCVYVLGGWFGILPLMLFHTEKFQHATIRSFDIDPNCARIAERINMPWTADGWRFKATTMDMTQMSYAPCQYHTKRADGSRVFLTETPDLIINTSCEHLEQPDLWWDTIPSGAVVALQSNNYYGWPDHVNCVANSDELLDQFPMSEIGYVGEKDIDSRYQRFMAIGRK